MIEARLIEFKRSMISKFDMFDLGKIRHFLGIEVIHSAAGIFICPRRYAQEVLEKFGMGNNNPIKFRMFQGRNYQKMKMAMLMSICSSKL